MVSWDNNGKGDRYSITALLVFINVTGKVLNDRGSIFCMHTFNFASLNLT